MTDTTGNPPHNPGRRARTGTSVGSPDFAARLDRLQPQNVEAEQSVLGAALIDNAVMSELAVKLRAEDFYRTTHRYIFDAMLHLYERREPIDYITVMDALSKIRAERQLDRLEVEVDLEYLAELAERVPTAANALFYAAQVRQKAILRDLIGATNEISRESFEFAGELNDFLDTVEQRIFNITQRDLSKDIVSIRSVLHEIFNKLDEYQDRAGRLTGIPSGYFQLDELTGGFQDGEMVVMAARPSMGKTTLALSVARYIGLQEKIPIVFFSCEMGRTQVVQNMLCAEARIDSRRMRSGYLDEYEYDKLVQAAGKLAEAPIFVDDTPGIGIREVRAKARRLRERYGIRIVFIDYLQLMSKPPGMSRNGSREQEIAIISRGLKALARELNIPIVVLAQLNRDVEKRTGTHRPRMSDLRESGCLAGDTLVSLADTGERVPIRDLVGRSGFTVWAADPETYRLQRATVSHAFATGKKPVYRLRTQLGRTIRATANHKFLTIDGWKRLDELTVGTHLALPREMPTPHAANAMSKAELALLGHLIGDGCTLPRHVIQYTTRERDLAELVAQLTLDVFGSAIEPRINRERGWYQVYLASTRHHTHNVRNAIAVWLSGLGIFGRRSHEKFVPECVFQQPLESVGSFLRHLWVTDGCIHLRRGKTTYPTVYYASSSERLSRDVQSLLLRYAINARIKQVSQGTKGRDQFHVIVSGRSDLLRFCTAIGTVGAYKTAALLDIQAYLATRGENTNRDVVPKTVWQTIVRPAQQKIAMTQRELYAAIDSAYAGTAIFNTNLSRERASRVATAVRSVELSRLADSDIYWDTVESIVSDGIEDVFDLTVPGPHNFVANDIVVHNSIEQDADVIGLLHREYYYTRNEEDRHGAELILAKQRNGPTGTVHLLFTQEFMRFDDAEDGLEREAPMPTAGRHGGGIGGGRPMTALPGLPHVPTMPANLSPRGGAGAPAPIGPGMGGLPADVANLTGDADDGTIDDEFGDSPFDYDGDDIPPMI